MIASKPFSYCTIRYDTIEELNVDSKAECDQLNLAQETKQKMPVPTQFSTGSRSVKAFGRNQKTVEEKICERDEF